MHRVGLAHSPGASRARRAITMALALAVLVFVSSGIARASTLSCDTCACMPDTAEFMRMTAGTLRGVVRMMPTGEVLAFATVSIEGRNFGCVTNEEGRFVILGVPPGPAMLKVATVGHRAQRKAVEVASRGETRVDFAFTDEHALLRDSLERSGRWPPTLDPRTEVRLRAATTMRARRFESEDFRHPEWADLLPRERGRGRPVALAWRDSLMFALSKADFESPLMGAVMECECTPDTRVVLSGPRGAVVVDLCHGCGTLSVSRDGLRQEAFFGTGSGWFGRLRPALDGTASPRH